MTTREREVAVRGCLACSIDHHHACSRRLRPGAAPPRLEPTRRPRPAEGERLMGQQDPLGPSRRCLPAGHCEAYGATRQLGVATYQHLGIDVDQMAALLYGEGGGDGQG